MSRCGLIVLVVFFIGSSSSTERKIVNTRWINVSIQNMDSPFLFEFDEDVLNISYANRFESFSWTRNGNVLSLEKINSQINNLRIFDDSLIVNSKEGRLKLLPLNDLISESILDKNKAGLIEGVWDVESEYINYSKGLSESYLDFLIDGTALWVYGKDDLELNSQILGWEYFKVKDVHYLRMQGVDENFILITNQTSDYVGGLFLGSDFGLEHNLIRRNVESSLPDVLELTNGSWSNRAKNEEIPLEGIDLTFESGLGGLYTIYYDVESLDIEGGDYTLSEGLNYFLFNSPDKEMAYPVKIEFVTKDSLGLNFQDKGQKYVFYRDDSMSL
ncbi:hypothetical protein CLW00_106261 [Mongoliibacter ruber]|uniref:Uncharacterized protein n=2 Tax=Mongoliibacter ruber TaxID=1750599 RepID=A0A2T0WM84_9BACT|nr:hypothetical protein CLW00_106261 [Mongoliibacter ruber]